MLFNNKSNMSALLSRLEKLGTFGIKQDSMIGLKLTNIILDQEKENLTKDREDKCQMSMVFYPHRDDICWIFIERGAPIVAPWFCGYSLSIHKDIFWDEEESQEQVGKYWYQEKAFSIIGSKEENIREVTEFVKEVNKTIKSKEKEMRNAKKSVKKTTKSAKTTEVKDSQVFMPPVIETKPIYIPPTEEAIKMNQEHQDFIDRCNDEAAPMPTERELDQDLEAEENAINLILEAREKKENEIIVPKPEDFLGCKISGVNNTKYNRDSDGNFIKLENGGIKGTVNGVITAYDTKTKVMMIKGASKDAFPIAMYNLNGLIYLKSGMFVSCSQEMDGNWVKKSIIKVGTKEKHIMFDISKYNPFIKKEVTMIKPVKEAPAQAW